MVRRMFCSAAGDKRHRQDVMKQLPGTEACHGWRCGDAQPLQIQPPRPPMQCNAIPFQLALFTHRRFDVSVGDAQMVQEGQGAGHI